MLLSFDLDGVLMENPFKTGVFPEIKTLIQTTYHKKKNKVIKKDKIGLLIRKEFGAYLQDTPYLAYDWDLIINNVVKILDLNIEINVEKLVEKYSKEPYIKAYSDGRQILNWLQERDYEIIIVTNGFYRYQFPVLKALKLNHYFSRIITSDRTKSAKPQPKSFGKIYRAYKHWLHIGDSLIMDVNGGNASGATSVYLNRSIPKELAIQNVEQRMSNKKFLDFVKHNLKKELDNYHRLYDNKLIYPDYIIKNLTELKKIVIKKEVENQIK